MAEVIGTVAGFTQLTGQIIASLQTIISFYRQIKNAPDYISSLLNDIDSNSKLFKRLSEDDEGDEFTLSSLRVAKEILEDLEELLGKLNSEVENKSWKGKMKVGGLKVVGKETLIKGMIERLERSKSSLNGALMIQRQDTSKLELQTSILTSMVKADMQIIMNQAKSDEKAAWEKLEVFSEAPSVKFATDTGSSETLEVTSIKDDKRSASIRGKKKVVIEKRWYWIGGLLTKHTHYEVTEDVKGTWPDDVEIETKWLPATWTYLSPLWKKKERVCGYWKKSLNPISVVPYGSLLFKACSRGNLDYMIELFDSGQGSIYDTLPDGTTLLHIAARFAHADLCRWLIEKGARADAVENRWGSTPIHMATSIDSFNTGRTYDTMRVLVEYGQSDTMAEMPRYDPKMRGITALELYRGCLEGFRYLWNQAHSTIDFKDNELVEYLVLEKLSCPTSEQIKLTRLVLDSVQGLSFQDAVVMKYCESNITLLHMAANGLSENALGLSADRKSTAEHLEPLISEILVAGADIHAVDEKGRTPFSYLVSYSYQKRKCFRQALLRWLEIVQKEGYDLSEYIHRETKILSTYFTTEYAYPPGQPVYEPYHMVQCWKMAYRSIKRSMDLETSDATGELILRFRREPLWRKKEQDEFFRPKVPGAWEPDLDAQRDWENYWRHYQIRSIDGFSFFIGPLNNGVREFGLYSDEACESG